MPKRSKENARIDARKNVRIYTLYIYIYTSMCIYIYTLVYIYILYECMYIHLMVCQKLCQNVVCQGGDHPIPRVTMETWGWDET